MYSLGILGGMGAKATVQLFDIIVENTRASIDQEHLNIVILNKASIPDRTANLVQNRREALLPFFLEAIKEFERLSVKNIVIPCNTSHLLFDELQNHTDISIINMVKGTLHYLSLSKLPKHVYILGTLGTINLRLFDIFNDYGIKIDYPSMEICEEVQRIIYRIKDTANHDMDKLVNEVTLVMQKLQNQCREEVVFILGCTELSLLNKAKFENFNCIDPLEIVGLIAILKSGGVLHENKLRYDYDAIKAIAEM